MGDLGKELREEFGTLEKDQIAWDMVGDRAYDFHHNRIYRVAATLFDGPDDVNPDENEYARGIVELVAYFTGANSDHLDEVAAGIKAHTVDLKFYAGEWVRQNGTVLLDGIDEDIQQWGVEEHSRSFDNSELEVLRGLISRAKITF